MKSNIFIACLARGAAATAVAGAAVMPSHQTATAAQPMAAQELAYANRAELPEATTRAGTEEAVVLTMSQAPTLWDKKLEREFRKLALEEARGTISKEDERRLQKLDHWRNQLLCPQTADEILLQLKRDHLLARMESLLTEYVQFQEAAAQKRPAA